MYGLTKEGGLGIHTITYEHHHPAFAAFGGWIDSLMRGQNPDHWQRWHDGLNEDEREDMLWTNKVLLDPQYLVRPGFKIAEYGIEDGDLIIITKKSRE